MSTSDAYAELGGGSWATATEPQRPRIGFVPGAWCPRHRGYPIETTDGKCARCQRDATELHNEGESTPMTKRRRKQAPERSKRPDCDELAADLVRRGLCSDAILCRPIAPAPRTKERP